MGLFGSTKRGPQQSTPHPLKQGTQIAIVDVNEEWVAWARAEKPREPRLGHRCGVALWAQGDDILVLAGNGGTVGRLSPRMADLYLPELLRLQKRGRIGTTDAFVKWEGSKSGHTVSLNWGERAVLGGIT